MVAQEIRVVINAINMLVADVLKHCQILGVFGDGATVMVQQWISCCVDGIQSEYIGTNFVTMLVVHLKAVL